MCTQVLFDISTRLIARYTHKKDLKGLDWAKHSIICTLKWCQTNHLKSWMTREAWKFWWKSHNINCHYRENTRKFCFLSSLYSVNRSQVVHMRLDFNDNSLKDSFQTVNIELHLTNETVPVNYSDSLSTLFAFLFKKSYLVWTLFFVSYNHRKGLATQTTPIRRFINI